jgi:penicillin-binding protein 2
LPNQTFVCRRHLHVGNHDLSCSHPETGPLNAVQAVAYSCNDFFATFGSRLSANEIKAAFVQAGFTSTTGLVAQETSGWIRLAQGEDERQLQAVGEGAMAVTALEMAAAYRKLALLRRSPTEDSDEHILFTGLEQATQYGTARLAATAETKVAGKTGTPHAEEGGWSHGWFAGYAPADKPEVVVVVFLEHGTGPGDAAPIAGQIFRAWAKAKWR